MKREIDPAVTAGLIGLLVLLLLGAAWKFVFAAGPNLDKAAVTHPKQG